MVFALLNGVILPPDYIKITFQKDIQNEDYRTLQIETFGNKVLTI